MHWEDNWESTSEHNIGGGQGDCFIIKSKSAEHAGKRFFLKVLQKLEDTERRRRFYIETKIYQSVSINNIPTVLETNADKYLDKKQSLYYVSNLIEGCSLDKIVNNLPIPEGRALSLFKQLLLILKDCHGHEIAHRDIKPENIMIDNDTLHLVDFGIAFRNDDEFDNITKVGQEIGNRFLRLPEMSAGSLNKTDLRTDLSFAVGVGFYMLTGHYPRVLMTEGGKLPHQNSQLVETIKALDKAPYWNLMFDKGFQQSIDSRWSSADEILKVVEIMEADDQSKPNYEEILQLHANQINHKYLNKLEISLSQIYHQIDTIINGVLANKAMGVSKDQQQWVYKLGAIERKAENSFYVIGRGHDTRLTILFRAKLIGNQVVGSIVINKKETDAIRVELGISPTPKEVNLAKKTIETVVLPEIVKLVTS
jgi:serine/threonine protein kinase